MAIHLINTHRFTPFGVVLVAAAGGISVGGSADAGIIKNAVAEGNIGIGNSVTFPVTFPLRTGNEAVPTLLTEEEEEASAGIIISGSASASIILPASASGGISINGEALPTATCWPLNFPITFPTPCNPPLAIGRIAIGGSAVPLLGKDVAGTGSVAIGGSSDVSINISQSASATGDISISGEAVPTTTCWPLNFPVSFPMPCNPPMGIATGEIQISGSAISSINIEEEEEATATVVITGAATASTSVSAPANATGNIVIGGLSSASLQALTITQSATGGIAIGGSATLSINIPQTASAAGDISITGSAISSTSISVSTSATGNIAVGGSATASTSIAQSASATGNIAIGGSATASVGIAQSASATGNVAIGGSATSSTTCWPLNFPVSFPMPCGAPVTHSATGNIVIGGSATASTTTNTTVNPAATGNVVIGGSATAGTSLSASGVATGNIVIGGSATGVTSMGSSTTNATATGNIIVGGSATATTSTSTTVNGAATGNIVIGGSATGTAAQPSNESLVAAMSGKEIWLDASVFDGSDASNNPSDTTEVGDGTYDWSDRTGNYTLTQYSPTSTDQPYYRSSLSAFNNKGAVHFPRGNRPLYISSGRTSGYKHLFVVHNAPYSNEAGTFNNNGTYMTAIGHNGEHRNSNQDKLLIRGGSGSDASRFEYTYDATWGEHYFENNAAFKDGVQVPDVATATYVASSRTQSNEPFSRKSISQKYTYPSSFADGSAPVIWEFKFTASTDQALRYLNRGEVNGVGFIYHIGELLAFTDHLSDADRITVYKYLADKYDIPVYTGEDTVVQESNLQHWFKFEEGAAGSGTGRYIRDWADSTKANYIRNGATLQSGRRGNCVRFADGVNDELSWTSHTYNLQSNYTFAFWAKRDNSNGGSVATIYSGSSGIEVQVGGSNTVFKHDSTSVTSTTVPAQGTWAHYALTYDGTTMTAYIDGTSVGTASLSSPSSGSMYIRAGRGISTANPFVGDMDDLRLYSVALTSSEVASVVADDSLNHYYNT